MDITIEFEDEVIEILVQSIKEGESEQSRELLMDLAAQLARSAIEQYFITIEKEIENNDEVSIGVGAKMFLTKMIQSLSTTTVH